jgi:hypothetical protein
VKKSKAADSMSAVTEIDPLDPMLRRIDAFVVDARSLAADLELHRERRPRTTVAHSDAPLAA